MGVQGLWDLLAPVGRRVSVETLAGKRLAIDASIWMIQFMKAMRDERGEMVRNAHLLGFFRRICKLLFLRTKPVFVFDGGTPALKRRTVIARRRQRENAQAKIRKTAEKLLINHLKSLRLKALAEELKNQKVKDNSKGKAIMQEQASTLETNNVSGSPNQEAIDEMLAASLAAEELGDFNGGSSTSASVGGNFDGTASTSAASFLPDDEDDEDDEEMILPITNGNVDPAVLASLPPSMQLDLLVQMRERLMAENRQKYQKVTKAPQKFSELQIEAYLKTVAFRREIDQVQKAASGRGVDGVQTSRIASEANREFIFSSSFTGDKQLLTERGAEQQGQKEHSFVNLARDITPAARSSSEAAPSADEHLRRIDDDVQTFLDERGRMRLSRRRAMGMRMTGDLERNIELMKELENNQAVTNDGTNGQVNLDESMISASGPGDNHGQSQPLAMEEQVCGGTIQSNTANSLSEGENHRDTPTGNIGTSIEISFGDNREQGTFDDDDELFASLVAGNQLRTPSADNSLQNKTDSSLECEWEEGTIGDTTNDNKSEERLCVGDDGDDEVEIEWEEGERDIHKDASSSLTDMKAVSKGSLEEEAALQEAIRRSLEDLDGKRSDPSHELKRCVKTFQEPFQRDSNSAGTSLGMGNDLLDGRPSHTSGSESMDSDCVVGKNLDIADFSGTASMLCGEVPAIADIDMISPGETNEYSYKQQVKASDDSAEIVVSAANGSRVHSHISSDATDSPAVAISHGSEAVPVSYSEKASDITVREGEMSLKESSSNTNFSGDVTKEYGFHMLQPGESTELITERDGVDDVEVTGADVEDELLKLSQEYKNLGDEQRKLERNAESVESEMFVGCQELLQMFGLPYIIAPMEAEAQCAYMELENLVDGVVTDDSDVFLFGARSVYKNIFDDRKYVETYFVKDIENELGLDREKLIGMALLLGSDYTEGISGIGIVNAIEVVTAFPEHDGLQQFRKWVESPDPTILGTLGMRRGLSSKEKGTKSTDNCTSSKNEMEDTLQENEDDQAMDIKQTFMDKHRNVSKNWHIPSSFPSEIVISAYQSPQVDKSTEPFSWGKPDLFSLRRLCWEKFGWSSQKADELLVPVLKEYNKHETQLRLEAFYSFNERFAKIRSKRIKQALKGVSGNQSSGLADADASQEGPQNMRKRKLSTTDNKRTRKKSLRGKSSAENLKQQRKRNDQNERLSSGEGNEQPSGQAEERVLESKEREGRGKRIARGVGRGQRKKSRGSELDETSGSHDRSTSNDEYEAEGGEVQKSHVLRRSLRERKPANYVENDVGTNEPASFVNESVAVCAIGDVGRDHDDVRGAEDSIPMADAPVEADKGDYLHMGGGFCVEGETETNQDELEHVTSTKSTSLPVDDFVDIDVAEHPKDNTNRGGTGSDEVEVEMRHISISESSNLLENGQGESRTSINALSAMPNLRRKRRKG